jgi:6,7-dimethyl-8-ribityllumazine synthase
MVNMPRIIEGQYSAKGKKFAIVVSRFNELISKKLLEGALDCITRHGGNTDEVDIAWVPGAFEIPVAAKRFAAMKKYDAIICLGAVIRGATPHFEYIAGEVTKGIAQVSLEFSLPVAYGVITPDTLEQALQRAGTKAGNKGWDAGLSAIEMADLFGRMNA